MKKILSLLLTFILLFLYVGCNNHGEQPKESEPVKVYENPPDPTTFHYGIKEVTFEPFESVIQNSTDIVKATYKGMVKIGQFYVLDFEIIDSLYCSWGQDATKNTVITVSYKPRKIIVARDDKTFGVDNTAYLKYSVGESYLLFLSGSGSECAEGIFYELVDPTIHIPLDKNNNLILSMSTMYGQKLNTCIEDKNLNTATTSESFMDVVLRSIMGRDFITVGRMPKEESFEEALARAPYVAIIEIKKEREYPSTYYAGYFQCVFLELIKGEIYINEWDIPLPSQKVEVGEKYIVALCQDFRGFNMISPYGFAKYDPSLILSPDFDKKSDIATLCTEAAYVYVVEVEEKQFVGRDCKIISSLKGEYENEKIYLFVQEDDFEVGKKYVVALDKDKKLIGMTEIFPTTQ